MITGTLIAMLLPASLAAPLWLLLSYTAILLLLSPILLVAASAVVPRIPLLIVRRLCSIPIESI